MTSAFGVDHNISKSFATRVAKPITQMSKDEKRMLRTYKGTYHWGTPIPGRGSAKRQSIAFQQMATNAGKHETAMHRAARGMKYSLPSKRKYAAMNEGVKRTGHDPINIVRPG